MDSCPIAVDVVESVGVGDVGDVGDVAGAGLGVLPVVGVDWLELPVLPVGVEVEVWSLLLTPLVVPTTTGAFANSQKYWAIFVGSLQATGSIWV